LASRQVTLLRRGWELGRLNFEYKQPLSRLRESFILRDIETDLYSEAIKLKATVDASIAAGLIGKVKKPLDSAYSSVERYFELTLPYVSKNNKINKGIAPEDLKAWGQALKNAIAKDKKEQSKKEK